MEGFIAGGELEVVFGLKDCGRGHHVPGDGVVRVEAGDSVGDGEGGRVGGYFEGAEGLGVFGEAEWGGEVDGGFVFGWGLGGDDFCGAWAVVELVVIGEGVVGEVVEAEDFPALAVLELAEEPEAAFFEGVVVLGAEVGGPALAEEVEDERAGVHMAVVDVGFSGFDAEVEVVFFKAGAVDGERAFSACLVVEGEGVWFCLIRGWEPEGGEGVKPGEFSGFWF